MRTKEKEKLDKSLLYLEASSDKTIVKLFSQSRDVFSGSCQGLRNQSEELLQEIDRLLKKGRISKKAVAKIIVNARQNSYTGVRVIATTANLFAFSLNIPIQSYSSDKPDMIRGLLSPEEDVIFQDFIVPIYKHEPIITRPKSRL